MSSKNEKASDRIKGMRDLTYMNFLDALTGLKKALFLIDERVQREGPHANYSVNSDLLEWSMSAWKHSNALYTLDQIRQSMAQDEIITKDRGEVKDDDVAASCNDGARGRRGKRRS